MSNLAARDISVDRGNARIVSNVTLNVVPGEFHTLIGPNGGGKSTVLRALAGLWTVASGEVVLDGAPLPTVGRRQLACAVSYVPQDTRIDFAFTVEEIVAMGRFAHRGRFEPESAADRKAVAEALERCDASQLRQRAVNTLSGGERQRVVIARSLAAQARYLLLDEPTANLDIRHALEVFELCRRLASEGRAILFATHDLASAAHYADRVSVMQTGRLVGSGAPAGVLTAGLFSAVFGVSAEPLGAQDGRPTYAFSPLTEPASPELAKTPPSGPSAPTP